MSSSNMPQITSGGIDGKAGKDGFYLSRYRLDKDRFLTAIASIAIVGLE